MPDEQAGRKELARKLALTREDTLSSGVGIALDDRLRVGRRVSNFGWVRSQRAR